MKRIFFLLFAFLMSASVFAQITTYWNTSQPARQLPTGFTAPTDSALTDFNQATFVIDVLDTIDHATPATSLTNIGNYVKTEIDSNYIEDIFGLDPALDIVGRVLIMDVKRRWDNFTPNDLKNQYEASSGIFRVRGKFQWVIEVP